MDSDLDALILAVLDGDHTRAVAEARNLLAAGVKRSRIVTGGVEIAMARLDMKCTVEQYNLLEIMLSGRAVTSVMGELYPSGGPPPQTKATVVLATLEGDVHDLGKNIFGVVLTASGYRVVDCGRNCPMEKLIGTAEREAPLAVGVSGLVTTVMPRVREVRERLAERHLGHIKILAGGAALKQASAEPLNVDFVAQTAFDGLHYLEALMGVRV